LGLILIVVIVLVSCLEAGAFTSAPLPYAPVPESKKSMVEARLGYLWGVNEIRWRDGDNPNIRPGRQEVYLQGGLLGIQGERFFTSDLAVRAQGWLDIPFETRSRTFLDAVEQSWDSRAGYLSADLAAIYHFGLGGMPYSAGIVAGYRYMNYDYPMTATRNPDETFNDHLHIHVPYLGVYYGHSGFVGTVVRLDVLASPFTLSRFDGERRLGTSVTSIDGHSLMGFWFESHFAVLKPVSHSAFVGAFIDYNFLELSGGVTLVNSSRSTRFSLDSRLHAVLTGLNFAYTF